MSEDSIGDRLGKLPGQCCGAIIVIVVVIFGLYFIVGEDNWYNFWDNPFWNDPGGALGSWFSSIAIYLVGGFIVICIILFLIFLGPKVYGAISNHQNRSHYETQEKPKLQKYVDEEADDSSDDQDSLGILKIRLAKGEITPKEYRELVELLDS